MVQLDSMTGMRTRQDKEQKEWGEAGRDTEGSSGDWTVTDTHGLSDLHA